MMQNFPNDSAVLQAVREMSMNCSSANAKDIDIEQIRISCASYFGAMCKKLAPMGKWDDIVEAFRLLSSRVAVLAHRRRH